MSAEDGVGFTHIHGEQRPKDSAWVRVVGALDELSVALANVEAVNEMARRENKAVEEIREIKKVIRSKFFELAGTSQVWEIDPNNPVSLMVMDWSDIDKLNAVKAQIFNIRESICYDTELAEAWSFRSALDRWEISISSDYVISSADDVPSGELLATQLYLAAAICHRAESEMVSVQSKVSGDFVKYLNQLAVVLQKLAYKHGYKQHALGINPTDRF